MLDRLEEKGGLRPGVAAEVHRETGVPEADIYGVATFYHLLADPDAVREQDGRWVPFELVMHDRLDGTRTLLAVDAVEFEPDLPERLFARSSLKRGR